MLPGRIFRRRGKGVFWLEYPGFLLLSVAQVRGGGKGSFISAHHEHELKIPLSCSIAALVVRVAVSFYRLICWVSSEPSCSGCCLDRASSSRTQPRILRIFTLFVPYEANACPSSRALIPKCFQPAQNLELFNAFLFLCALVSNSTPDPSLRPYDWATESLQYPL